MTFILKSNINTTIQSVTKEAGKALIIMILGVIVSTTTLIMKYKIAYEVKLDGKVVGYISSKADFNNTIQNEILGKEEKNVDTISLSSEPEYELKLVSRSKDTNEQEILAKLEKTSIKTYKYYAVKLNNSTKVYVDTLEEAEEVVKDMKSEYKSNDVKLNITLDEKYTQKKEEVKTEKIEKAEMSLEEEIESLLKAEEAKKAIATIKGINLSALPVSGRISSRFGVSSSIRSGAHTGLDIACDKGTNIKVVSSGKVIFAEENGAYGNLIKVDHGNGIETWYAHCDKIIAKVGDKVKAGDIIGKVGSTGNSTGPHLHLEIRVNGTAINPQKYLYKNK